MDEVIALIGLTVLAVLAVPATIIYLIVAVSGLRRRLEAVERRLAAAEAPPEASAQPEQQPGPVRPAAEAAARAPEPTAAKAPDPAPQPVPQPLPVAPEPQPRTPRAPSGFDRLIAWVQVNWFYALAAISLALAGIFLVQYGAENGFLPPKARVVAAILFGMALIGAGEVLRRRFGDHEGASTAYIPSAFSGAGVVSVLGAILAARQMYGLIGPEAAFAAMAVVAVAGLLLGWFHGPLLAAVSVIGAMLTPFIVGGSSEDPSWLYGYFALIAALGLGIDTFRRWAWLSVLSVVLAYCGGTLLYLDGASSAGAAHLFAVAMVLAAILIPVRRLWPDHEGAMIWQLLNKSLPGFPTFLAAGAVLASSFALVVLSLGGVAEFWLSAALLTGLGVALVLWSDRAAALQELELMPALGLLAVVNLDPWDHAAPYPGFAATYDIDPEAALPLAATLLVGLALLLGLAAAWRAFRPGLSSVWGAAAVLVAPAMAVVLDITWNPVAVLGPWVWALHGAALAAFATVLAERFARVDGPDDRLRAGIAAMVALACLSYSVGIILSDVALTLALVVAVIAAAELDRRFDLPAMGIFITLGSAAIGYRLVVDPGVIWAESAPVAEVIAAYVGATLGYALAWWRLAPRNRPRSLVVLETAGWSALGLAAVVLIHRTAKALVPAGGTEHWEISLFAAVWLGLMTVQILPAQSGGSMRLVRIVLASVFGLIGLGALAIVNLLGNPLATTLGAMVSGPPVLNTLLIAYLPAAAVLVLAARRVGAGWLRMFFGSCATVLGALWLFSTIRHFWQGAAGMPLYHGMGQPELYTYTVALLIIGGALFYQSLTRNSVLLRRLGLLAIGLAVAKVFLVDITGLGGLIRVFSLLALGLSLAGLAWLDRWARSRTGT